MGDRRAGVSGIKGAGNRESMGKETGGDCICERERSVKNITILHAYYFAIGKEQTGAIRPDRKKGTGLKDPGNGKIMHPLPQVQFYHRYNFIDDDS